MLRIPMPTTENTQFGMIASKNIRPMVYYNFVDQKWDIIGQPIDSKTAASDVTAQVKNDGVMSGACIGFSRGMEMLYDNPRVNCQPISSFGFPINGRYHATSSQVFLMSKLIDRPFLVEKVVLRLSASTNRGNDSAKNDRAPLFAYYGVHSASLPDPGRGSPASVSRRAGNAYPQSSPTSVLTCRDMRLGDEDGGASGRLPNAIIHSFFILNQRSPFSASIHHKVAQLNPRRRRQGRQRGHIVNPILSRPGTG